MLHAHDKQTREPLRGSPLRLVMSFHLGRQDCHAEQRREHHRDDPRYQQGDRNHHEQRESVFTGLLLLSPIGMNPATVTSVPVSIGNAVEV